MRFDANTSQNRNTNNSNQREEAVLWFNPNIGGWSPRYGVAITKSDIMKSEVLQAITAAMTNEDGTKDLSPAEFKGISGNFRWNVSQTKEIPNDFVLERIS